LIKLFGKIFITSVVLILLGYFSFIYIIPKLSEHEQKKYSRDKETAFIKRVIDGDTYELENRERVRALGIDTPEKYESNKLDRDAERTGQDKKTIKRLGQLATDYVKDLLEGKKVELVREPDYEDRDAYGRLLRYVYLEDGTFVNMKIIEEGYATAFRKYKISKLNELIEAEKHARINKKGLWGDIEGLKQFDIQEAPQKNKKKE
jgi:micrococcal nuclease